MKKVMVAMSGGVDSSVALLKLMKDYETIGVTLKLHDGEYEQNAEKTCCSLSDIEDAKNVAARFGIMHYVYNLKELFEKKVISEFIESYEKGYTPNPCINCNRYIKFEALLDRAIELDCDYIVLDRQNAGIGVYDALVLPLYDPERQVTYEPLCSLNDEEMIKRCPYNDAKKVIYTIAASESFNDKIARELKDELIRHRIELLGDSETAQTYFDSFPEYYKLDAEVKNTLRAPYSETESLILEMVQLEITFGNTSQSYLRLKTTGRNRKDRYTALAYGNYIANLIERETFKPDESLSLQEGLRSLNNALNGRGGTSLRNKLII